MTAKDHLNTLKSNLAKLQARLADAEQHLPDLHAACRTAEARMDEMTLAEMTGAASINQIDEAKQVLQQARNALEDAERTTRLCQVKIPSLNLNIAGAEDAAKHERNAKAEALAAVIEKRLQADKKLRAQLVELFGLAATTSIIGADGVNWTGVLAAAFPCPEGAEAEQAFANAMKTVAG